MILRTITYCFIAALLTFSAHAQEVTYVTDGDTFRLKDGRTIRLCGIDAPERGTQAGTRASQYLRGLILNKSVDCTYVGQGSVCDGRSRAKSRNRFVAQCFIDGRDIAAELVSNGHARDWPKFSGGHYGR